MTQPEVALIALGWTIASSLALIGVAWLREKIRADMAELMNRVELRLQELDKETRERCDERHRYHPELQRDVAG